MVGLPLLKLGGLAMKTLAKPVVRYCLGYDCEAVLGGLESHAAAAAPECHPLIDQSIPIPTTPIGEAAEARGHHAAGPEAALRERGAVDAPRDGVDHHLGRGAQEPRGACVCWQTLQFD